MTNHNVDKEVSRSEMKRSSRALLREMDEAEKRVPWQRIEGWPRRPENRQ